MAGFGCLKVSYICSLLLLSYKNSEVGESWLELVGVGCLKIADLLNIASVIQKQQSWWKLVGVGRSWLELELLIISFIMQ